MAEARDGKLIRMGFIRKKSDWEWAAFEEHWLGPHAKLAGQLKGLRGYVQNHIIDRRQRSQAPRGGDDFDGFSQLWFENDAAMRDAIATDLGRALVADESHFLGHLRIVTVSEEEIIPLGAPRPPAKLLTLLKRRSDISAERFHEEWRGLSPLVEAMHGIRGYRQGFAIARQVPKGTPVGYDRFPIDGVEEIWFDSVEALDHALASDAGRNAFARGKSLMAEATTFLVEECVIA